MDIRPGLFRKYELRERLGRGGMAEVWKAFDPRLERYVAIKFLQAALQSDPSFVTRFVREAQAVASLRHPNIVQIYDFETPSQESEDVPAYMVMDYIEGPTLADYLHKTSSARNFPSAAEMVSLFLSISDAIDYAHQRGLVHRDIKPANILLDQHHTARNPMGEPMLTDFGIVKILGTAAATLTAASFGTPVYISPERARGNTGSSASDIYSLGVILYEMCTGTPPFKEDSPLAILLQHVSAPPPPPESINPAISRDLSEVILHGLAKEPEDRFPSAMALTTGLAEALKVPLPDRKRQPISSPDLRTLPGTTEDLLEISALKRPEIDNQEQPLLPPAMPPTFIYIPSSRVPAILGEVAEKAAEPLPDTPSSISRQLPAASQPRRIREEPEKTTTLKEVSEKTAEPTPDTPSSISHPLPPASRPRRSRVRIVFIALLLVVVVGSGLTALFVSRAGSSSTTIVGHAFFASSGAAPGANNRGINDMLQVTLSNVQLPQAGKSYFAWLLPDQNQSEANPRALGTLVITNGAATLPFPYVDPQHNNLIVSFSRFLVTEEPTSPVPLDPSLNKGTWRYYAAIPQNPPVQNCVAAINQLNDLCHLRHLLSGDPELAQVNLSGGLNYWFLHNIKALQQWARDIADSNAPIEIHHKLADMLYLLDGINCISQDLLPPAPQNENTPDDPAVTKVAAIALLNCSLTPNITGYLTHIHNHLGAMVQSPGVLQEQVTLANSISPELDIINSWLQQIHQDARHLITMDDSHLLTASKLRSDMDSLATKILNGGTDSTTNSAEKGVSTIAAQIQQLATMDITRY